MIIKKRVYKADKKVNPFIGVLTFFNIHRSISHFRTYRSCLRSTYHSFIRNGTKGIGEFLLKIAISVDQLGNVIMQHLLNSLWVKKGRYNFGNRDETISSALGRNKKLGTLTAFGNSIDKLLDTLDPNHSLNSIDYYIEPSEQIIDKLAWVHIIDGRILMTRTEGREKYYIPGGKREHGENDAKALSREIKRRTECGNRRNVLIFYRYFRGPGRWT